MFGVFLVRSGWEREGGRIGSLEIRMFGIFCVDILMKLSLGYFSFRFAV